MIYSEAAVYIIIKLHELQDNIKEDLIFNLQKYNIKHKKHPPQFL